MGAVAALYHADKHSFLFVKQFRAPVYYNRMKDGTLDNNDNDYDNNSKGHQVGCTIECIAGLMDKPESVQTIQEELKEEVDIMPKGIH